jgi:hypothetical protein
MDAQQLLYCDTVKNASTKHNNNNFSAGFTGKPFAFKYADVYLIANCKSSRI